MLRFKRRDASPDSSDRRSNAATSLVTLAKHPAPPGRVARASSFDSLLSASRFRQGCILGLLCALFIASAELSGWLDGLQRGTLNAMFRSRGWSVPSPNIVLVEAEEGTVARYGQWPLPRQVYANLIRSLHKSGAKTIAFDVQFPVASERPKDDRAFVQACREAGNVIQAMVFSPQEMPDLSMNPAQGKGLRENAKRFRITSTGDEGRDAVAATAAFKELLDTAPMTGHVTVVPEWSGGLLRLPHIFRYQGDVYPSLALATAIHYLGLKPKDVVATDDAIKIGGRTIPINENGETLVNWTGPTGTIPSYTFQDVLEPNPDERVPPDTFKDAIVLIGITHPGAYERYATPFSPNQPAVELQANALDNILENRALREAPDSWHLLLLVFASLVAGVLTAHRGARASALWTAGIIVVLWFLGFGLLWRILLYLDVSTSMLGVLLTCATTLAYRQLRDARDLKIAEERYALAARGANDGIWDWNLQTGEIYYSPRWHSMLGYADTPLPPQPEEWFNRIHSQDVDKLRADLDRHLNGHSTHFENEHRILHADGTYRWVLARGLRVLEANGAPGRIAGSLTDMTDRKVAEEQLLHNAFYDGLTGLPNRALFMDRLGRAIGRARRHTDYMFAVLFLDLDRFKVVNDSLGHVIGDQLLITVARRLESCLRPGDTAARLGGDEFTLLLDDIHDEEDATRVADRFQAELAKPFSVSGHEVFPGASIGIAISGNKGTMTRYERPDDLLRDADTAMYSAKATGRGRHEIFDEGMHTRAVDLLKLETDFRRALEHRDFYVYYQPIVSLKTGRIAGFEALARWQHPERGIVPPGEFIALAEETGLIIQLDHTILNQACRQLCSWQDEYKAATTAASTPSLVLSANLSSRHFSQPNLPAQIKQILDASGFPAEHVRLEITESVILENIESAARLLNQLKELGVQLALDDFGTGYSSLSYLHRLPLDVLKIDRSFVTRMDGKEENSEIVRAIITLARNMKMTVIAEGVETEEQLQQLAELDCDFGQGFYFGRPLSSEQTGEILMQDRVWEITSLKTGQLLNGSAGPRDGAMNPDGATEPTGNGQNSNGAARPRVLG
jgi:diguanylate cyclase (GGDEF)-like protein/PAS domain S-box-containing protein